MLLLPHASGFIVNFENNLGDGYIHWLDYPSLIARAQGVCGRYSFGHGISSFFHESPESVDTITIDADGKESKLDVYDAYQRFCNYYKLGVDRHNSLAES
ncbi:MAG: hypothetical protein WBW34_12405 [Nitrososphaeraceae archaeon]